MAKRSGKIRVSVLAVSLLIIAFFILAGSIIYHNSEAPIVQPPAPTSTPITGGTTPTTTPTSSPIITPPHPTSTVTPPPPPITGIGHAVGIAAGGGLSKTSSSTLNQDLDQMVNLGVTWVRYDIEWGNVQYSSSSSFTWSSYDNLVNAVAAHHMNSLITILFTPGWARAQGCKGGAKCPPGDPAQYAKFAAEVAARYKDQGVHAYEIWNEPNNYNFWATKTDCVAYTNLLKVTYPAIKAADPKAIVITGGLAPEATDKNNISQLDFMSCVYKNGGEPYFDAVGDHPYSFPAMPSKQTQGAWGQMSLTSPSLRSMMVANGDANKKIWSTEYGAPTNGPDPHWFISEAQQSQMVTDSMTLYKSFPWAGPFFWYTLQDGGTTTDTIENFFGLLRFDGSIKPAYTTLQKIIAGGL